MAGETQPESDRKRVILHAAVQLADDKGLEAVTMRAVAERAGLTAMALYPHVGTKAELLDEMAGLLLSEMQPVPAVGPAAHGSDLRQRLYGLAHSVRRLIHDHPWVAVLLFSRPAGTPEAARVVDQVYAALLDAGVPAPEVPRLERLLSTVILGYAASEKSGRFGTGPDRQACREWLVAAARAGHLPAHAALVDWLDRPVDWDAEFEADLDDLERLIETVASRGSAG
jgi:AcrR family transcriptional regulator